MYYVHKGSVQKRVDTLQEKLQYIDNGWQNGKCRKHWVTNGVINKLLVEGEDMPIGFRYGQSDDFKNKNRLAQLKRWKNMTNEQRNELSNSVRNGVRNMWQNMTESELLLRENHRMNTRSQWSEEYKVQYHNILSDSAKKEIFSRSP